MTPMEILKDMLERQSIEIKNENSDLLKDYTKYNHIEKTRAEMLHLKNCMFLQFIKDLQTTILGITDIENSKQALLLNLYRDIQNNSLQVTETFGNIFTGVKINTIDQIFEKYGLKKFN